MNTSWYHQGKRKFEKLIELQFLKIAVLLNHGDSAESEKSNFPAVTGFMPYSFCGPTHCIITGNYCRTDHWTPFHRDEFQGYQDFAAVLRGRPGLWDESFQSHEGWTGRPVFYYRHHSKCTHCRLLHWALAENRKENLLSSFIRNSYLWR